MGTRSVIARAMGDGFRGRYHHWDGYPTGLGKQLWELYHGHFGRNLAQMLKVLIDDHPAGWSTIVHKDFGLSPGYINLVLDGQHPEAKRPQCYCHGERHEVVNEFTERDAAVAGCEWAYAFDGELRIMNVLASLHEDGTKMVGWFGMGDPKSLWSLAGRVELEGPEPDWGIIECGEALQRCGHYACLHGAPGCEHSCPYCHGTGVASVEARRSPYLGALAA